MITMGLKRGMLEDAWDAVEDDDTLREVLRANETKALKTIASGSFSAVQANGRRSEFAGHGPGQVTPTEMATAWRELIDFLDIQKGWLDQCALYGLDPAQTELQGFPTGLTAVSSPAEVTDQVLFDWMMAHLVPITEARSDYGGLRLRGGMMFG